MDETDGGAVRGAARQVTRLAFQAHDQSRVNVFIDGRFAFALSAVEAVARGLKPGRTLAADEFAALQRLADLDRARLQAVTLLSYRPRSRRELAQRLQRKGYAPELVEQVVADLEARGYVDDATFARYWVENRQANRPRGQQALTAELRAKGVDATVAAEAVAPVAEDEEATALALARKRVRSLADLDDQRFRQRLGAFLQRKGYRYEIVRAVVQRLLRERDGTAPVDDEFTETADDDWATSDE